MVMHLEGQQVIKTIVNDGSPSLIACRHHRHLIHHHHANPPPDEFISKSGPRKQIILPGDQLPLLSWVSDQGLFAAYLFLAVDQGYRLAFFADACHQESNIDSSLLDAIGYGHLDDKMLFIARFKHGPCINAGHWFGQLQECWKAHKQGIHIAFIVC